jgi:hypothetical protein
MNPGHLNLILLSLLGSQSLVDRWWVSPNKAFEMATPKDTHEKEPKKVIDYILTHSRGDYY